MIDAINAKILIFYHDHRFDLDVNASTGHRAYAPNRNGDSMFPYESKSDEYDKFMWMAKHLASQGGPVTIAFDVVGEGGNVEQDGSYKSFNDMDLYRSTVRYSFNRGEPDLTLLIHDASRDELVMETLPGGSTAAARAFELAFGGMLACCYDFNKADMSLITDEHRAFMDKYKEIPELNKALPELFPKPKELLRHETTWNFQKSDVDSFRDLVTKEWSSICSSYGLEPKDEFPMFLDMPMDDGCQMRLEFKKVNEDLPLRPTLSLLDPADNYVGTIDLPDNCFPYGTHEFEFNGETYSVDFLRAPEHEYQAYGGMEEDNRGYTPEWHAKVVEKAAEAFAIYGAEYGWQAEDAFIWATEELTTGPHDFRPELYDVLVKDVEERCQEVKGTLQYRMAEARVRAEQQKHIDQTSEKPFGR